MRTPARSLLRSRRTPVVSSLACAPVLALLVAMGLGVGACSGEDKSNLEKLADAEAQSKAEVKGSAGEVPPEEGKPEEGGAASGGQPSVGAGGTKGEGVSATTSGDWPVDEAGIPVPPQTGAARLITAGADDDRVNLRLTLEEGTQYRITTLGMLKLPLMEQSTGFAREEDLSLSGCRGEGAERSCLLTHRYRNYEAEPPAGSGLEADERQVAALETAHRVDASGLRNSETAVHGEAPAKLGKQLAQVHRLYCLRFPAEAVGLGATWRDACRMRQGGQLVTRELTWRFAKLERNDVDGARAELEYAGRVRRVGPDGKAINGEVKGVLYFWVDAGEPHLMRERLGFVLNPQNGVGTTTDLRYQFTRLDEDGETLLRTDGKPFEQSPNALNDPRSAPSGATRDGELKPERKREK